MTVQVAAFSGYSDCSAGCERCYWNKDLNGWKWSACSWDCGFYWSLVKFITVTVLVSRGPRLVLLLLSSCWVLKWQKALLCWQAACRECAWFCSQLNVRGFVLSWSTRVFYCCFPEEGLTGRCSYAKRAFWLGKYLPSREAVIFNLKLSNFNQLSQNVHTCAMISVLLRETT